VFQVSNRKEFDMFDKKALAKKMISGVDIVRLVLYKVLTDDFSEKYKEKGEEFYKTLAGTMVNEIFGSHTEASQITFDENEQIIIGEIKNLCTKYPELKRPITDAIRVLIQASFMLNGNLPENHVDIFKNAMNRGVFLKGGENPDPKTFLKVTEELRRKYLL
jgi:hypothetical protein